MRTWLFIGKILNLKLADNFLLTVAVCTLVLAFYLCLCFWWLLVDEQLKKYCKRFCSNAADSKLPFLTSHVLHVTQFYKYEQLFVKTTEHVNPGYILCVWMKQTDVNRANLKKHLNGVMSVLLQYVSHKACCWFCALHWYFLNLIVIYQLNVTDVCACCKQTLTLMVGNEPTAKNKFPATSQATVRLLIIWWTLSAVAGISVCWKIVWHVGCTICITCLSFG